MAEVRNIGIQKIKRHIKALKDVKSKKKSLLSLVISASYHISDVTKELETWKRDIKFEDAIPALTSAKEILEKYSKVPANGLIIYTGIVYTDDGQKVFTIGFEPFRFIFSSLRLIRDTFAIEALTKLLEHERIPLRQENPCLKNFFDSKKSVYGVDTWKRLGDVEILFVSENLDINCYKLKNTRTGEVVTKHLNKQQEDDKSNFRGSKTIYRYWRKNDELEVLEKTPLLDWLAKVHQEKLFGYKYKLEFVSDTEEGLVFYHACGGIGGILSDHVNIQDHFVVLLVGLVAYLVIRSTLF